ncbi:fumarylacetoacetate hydrolase family protein [Alteribacter natronophilus]|uniref:fumarylacetoacetate hydrolase family protein n=1 Tax=Alteribacter natronophilus TaxID=2583810 RepID=UPI00110E5200|nr:fumarylacetoacetate hydrolase family protein [Alteribacter natronophilus]TMW73386.1 fumarylacetoacetate hydrolase family protein [Alteribacter natronophilus]
MEQIKNIYCIGRNYASHAQELGNKVPKRPLIFSKPTHSLRKADGTVELPADRGEIHYEAEIVLKIGRTPGDSFTVEEVVDAMALGIDFTLREEQTHLKEKGHPWLRAKGFKNAAVLTDFWDFPGTETCVTTEFSLVQNNDTVQSGKASDMIFDFQSLIAECRDCFGIGPGDIIFTGTPKGVGKTQNGDLFSLFWGNERKGEFDTRIM